MRRFRKKAYRLISHKWFDTEMENEGKTFYLLSLFVTFLCYKLGLLVAHTATLLV